jgi:hypothetical protein
MRSDQRPYRPDTLPINGNIVDDGIQLRSDPVVLVLGEDYGSAMVTFRKCFQDLRRVVSLVPECLHRAGLAIAEWPNWSSSEWTCRCEGRKSYKHSSGENGMHVELALATPEIVLINCERIQGWAIPTMQKKEESVLTLIYSYTMHIFFPAPRCHLEIWGSAG